MIIYITETLFSLRVKLFLIKILILVARLFGYPQNPGIPINIKSESPSRRFHDTLWPTVQFPSNIIEVLWGTMPIMNPIRKIFIGNYHNGPCSFFVENYKNIRFLPSFLSQFLQILLDLSFDVKPLESTKELIFTIFMVYADMIAFRIILILFWGVNPRKFPFKHFCVLVDWFDVLVRAKLRLPTSILGLNGALFAFIGFLGFLADNLNNLVFTMPFLPYEAEKIIDTRNQKHFLVFRYLPLLWYKYGIPNEISEFWYSRNPYIIKYMTIVYEDLNLQILQEV